MVSVPSSGRPAICRPRSNWSVQNQGTAAWGSSAPAMLRPASAPCSRALRQDFEADAAVAVEGEREGAAVAGGEDGGVAGGEAVVDGDAVGGGEAGGFGEGGVRDGADSDDDEVGLDGGAVGEADVSGVGQVVDFGDVCVEQDAGAVALVRGVEGGGEGVRGRRAGGGGAGIR